jgi:hydrocephalus-inducing protein
MKLLIDDFMKKPSEYIKERSLDIEERLVQASRNIKQPKIVELVGDLDSASKVSDVPVDKPLFQPLPSEIVLQNYESFKTYEIVISFRNNDKVHI